jgi:hypothetical protein
MRLFLLTFLLLIASPLHAAEESVTKTNAESTDAKVTLACDAKVNGATCPNPNSAGDCKRITDSCGGAQQSVEGKSTKSQE